jgi:ring-1,2-phenylacetyl-CoA epoxidase subunit PaaD
VNATTGQVWEWLEAVPDPEIPVISVVELGIVRDVEFAQDGECVVTITPTYSGCPAMITIAEGIGKALAEHGVERHRLQTRLAPAWTTDWMSDAGRRKLRDYGIAPPQQRADGYQAIDISALRRPDAPGMAVACPRCGSTRTRLVSRFGSTSCKALYVCQDCREPFDHFKSH